ncbi:MAG: hypothetical protein ABEH59_12835 [Halobacteriales archaeon]
MTPHQIAAVLLSVLALGAGAVGAVQVSENTSIGPPPWASNDSEGDINISVAGNVTPGETVTLTATLQGEPVPHAPVEVNGERVGETDANGQLAVTVPEEDEFEVEIEPEYEGETTVNLDDDDEEADLEETEDEERSIDLAIDGKVTPNETVSITATVNGTPLANAAISANGEEVGTTDANGTVTTAVPRGAEEFEVEAEYEHKGKLKVALEDDKAAETEDDRELQVAVDGDVSPGGTVTVSVFENTTPIENATVTLNDEPVGTTDETGQLEVTLPADADEVEIEVETADGDSEWEQEFRDETDDDEEEESDVEDEEDKDEEEEEEEDD